MINPEWLQDHQDFNIPSRIADNGRLWGDLQDPEEMAEIIRRAKMEKSELKRKKKTVEASKVTKKKSNKGKGKEIPSNTAPQASGSRPAPVPTTPASDDDLEDIYG